MSGIPEGAGPGKSAPKRAALAMLRFLDLLTRITAVLVSLVTWATPHGRALVRMPSSTDTEPKRPLGAALHGALELLSPALAGPCLLYCSRLCMEPLDALLDGIATDEGFIHMAYRRVDGEVVC